MTTSKKAAVRIAPDASASTAECATYVENLLRQTLLSAPRATIAISGGNTPIPMFRQLASSGLDWSKIHIFWVDERCVPPTDDRSNFKAANEALLLPAAIPASNIHRILGEEQPDLAASKYIGDISQTFSLASGELPVFDILHRGMGPDAHTGSLFPGEPLISNKTDIAAHVWVEKMKMDRITLLPGVLAAAKHTVLQAVGNDKVEALYQVLYGPQDLFAYPCQIAARNSDRTVWFVDKEAAARVEGK